MPQVKRIFQVVVVALGYAVYVWVAAVRGVPEARRRRAAKRAARRASWSR